MPQGARQRIRRVYHVRKWNRPATGMIATPPCPWDMTVPGACLLGVECLLKPHAEGVMLKAGLHGLRNVDTDTRPDAPAAPPQTEGSAVRVPHITTDQELCRRDRVRVRVITALWRTRIHTAGQEVL